MPAQDSRPAQLNAPCLGTYGSILDTLRHTVQSDRWYITRFELGKQLPRIEDDAQMTFAEMRMACQPTVRRGCCCWVVILDPDRDGQ